MTDMTEQPDDSVTAAPETTASAAPLHESRFLFVDVAALRAKQLRRGALPRLGSDHHDAPHKLERVAMEEVRRGLVDFSVPEWTRPTPPEAP